MLDRQLANVMASTYTELHSSQVLKAAFSYLVLHLCYRELTINTEPSLRNPIRCSTREHSVHTRRQGTNILVP